MALQPRRECPCEQIATQGSQGKLQPRDFKQIATQGSQGTALTELLKTRALARDSRQKCSKIALSPRRRLPAGLP
eukprot:8200818-Pyramimonas_sp.AAC.1